MRRAGVLVLVAFLLLVSMGAFAWVGVAQTGGVSYSDGSVSPTALPTGSAIDATISVNNAEDSEQTYNVSVSVDGTVEQWENGTIAANDDKNIRIRKTLWEAGERTVTIEAGSTTVSETVTVEAANPTYHGDNRNIGHYPDQVGPTAPPEEIWNSPGTHNAQPSLVNGTLYSSFTSDTYGVSALDPKTGDVVWSSGIGTSTTPTYANGVLYFGNTDVSDPKLNAVDAETGSLLGDFSTQSPIQSKPVVVDDTVYFGSDDSNMTALSATELAQGGVSEGDQRWNYTVSESDNIHVETPPAVVDGMVYFGTDNDNILAVDSETGDKIWEVEVHDSVRGAPTVVNNTVYFGASLESGDQFEDGMVYALNATDGTEQWTYGLSSNPSQGSVYADGILYVGASNGKLVALDATDGSELWLRSGSALSRFDSSPIVVNNTVYVSNLGDDTVQAFDGTDGTELFAYESPGEDPGSTPLVWDGILYYGTSPKGEGALYAIRDPALSISNMTASNPEAADVQVSFETAQQLSTISVSITGPESVTLTEDDFIESESGPYTYTGTYSGSVGGTYTATLDSAVSAKGDGALNEADSTTIPNGISTWSELDDVRTDLDADYVLLNDLNESTEGYDEFASESANGDEGWDPIGIDSSSAFTGTFDGERHTISDLYIDHSAEGRVGLFQEIGGATISNMSLTNATVSGNSRVALLTGSATAGSIDRVHAEGAVDSAGDSGGFVGGIDDDGASLQISNSSADVDVSGGAGSVGGLVGWGNDAEISETYVTGNVTTEADRVGGIIGESRDGSISQSYATVNITHESNSYDGLGGLVGLLRGDDGKITESYAAGNISDSDGGGLVGITGDSPTVTDSYWDVDRSGLDDGSGEGGVSGVDGLTTDKMTGLKATGNMTAFDFPDGDGTWHVIEEDYPALAWEDTDPFFGVDIIETNSPVVGGETLTVTTTVTNWADDGTQTVTLTDTGFTDEQQDEATVTLDSGESAEGLTFEWETHEGDGGTGAVTVTSETDTDSVSVEIGDPVVTNVGTGERYVTVQGAIDAANADETLEFEAGTIEQYFEIDESLTLRGQGSGDDGTTLEADSGTLAEITAADVTVEDLTMNGTSGGETAIDVANGATDTTVQNVWFEGFEMPIVVSGDDAEIRETELEGADRIGIALDGVDGATVENNTVKGSGRYGIFLDDSQAVVVSGNDLVDNGDGEYRELEPTSEGEIEGPADSGVALWRTEHSTVEANNITGSNPFGISIEESSHNEFLDNVIDVEGSDSGGIQIGVDSSENTISRSKITRTGTPGTTYDSGLSNLIYVATGEHNVVTDNELDGEGHRGIRIRVSSNVVIENNTISGSFGHGIEIFQSDEIDPSLYESNPGPATVRDNTLRDVEVELKDVLSGEIGGSGIYFSSEYDVETRNNTGTESGPDMELYRSEQFVENQSITTLAGETTMSFDGEELVLDGVEEPPDTERPGSLVSTGYYFEVENVELDGETYAASLENLKFAYDETALIVDDTTVLPETLSLWRFDGDEWVHIEDSAVDTDDQVITGNVTDSGTVGVFGNGFADGDGSETDPYVIEDWHHLDIVQHIPDSNFTLGNDMNESTDGYDDVASDTANDGDGFEPIGDLDDEFTGHFDGDSHTISELYINRSNEDHVGLFGYVDIGTVENIGLENVSVNGDEHVGGLVGNNLRGTVTESYVTGDIEGSSDVGGLIGINDDGEVRESYATGSIEGSGDRVGGLVGWNNGVMSESHATGSVEGSNRVGGLVGYNDGFSGIEISNTFASGTVNGSAEVGGLVGNNTDQISTSFATGHVNDSGTDIGGLVGSNSGSVDDSYWDTESTTQSTSTGNATGLSTAQMTGSDAPAELTGFVFTDTWVATESYPTLTWNATDPFFAVDIDSTTEPVDAGDTLTVIANITNWGLASSQTVTLTDTDFTNSQQDDTIVSLASGDSDNSVTLQWSTDSNDDGTGDITVDTANESATATVTVEETSSNGGGGGGSGGGGGGSGGSSDSTQTGETTVTVGGSDDSGDDDTDSDGEDQTAESTSSDPDTSVSVTGPQPGQRLVIEGGTARIEDGTDPDPDDSDDADAGSDDTTEPAGDDSIGDSDGSDSSESSDDTATDTSNVRTDRLSVDLNTNRDFELSVTTYQGDLSRSASVAPQQSVGPVFASGGSLGQSSTQTQPLAPETVRQAATAFERETNTVSAGYVDVEHTLEAGENSGSTFEFSIRQAYLDELGVEPDEVMLYHRQDGSWESRETTHRGSDDTHHRFEGTAPGFSVFALGTNAAPIAVTDASLDSSPVTPGEEATVSATVENRGQGETEERIELTVDGKVVDSERLTLDGGDTTEINFAYTPEETGEYSIAVSGTDAGVLTVSEAGVPWWLGMVALLAVLAGGVWWRRQQ